ncbi:hypothetical protein T09_1190 [Trichinella sp. T9]|nr:hypothetical protein T09_1190 [Trichinella sp. T9]
MPRSLVLIKVRALNSNCDVAFFCAVSACRFVRVGRIWEVIKFLDLLPPPGQTAPLDSDILQQILDKSS